LAESILRKREAFIMMTEIVQEKPELSAEQQRAALVREVIEEIRPNLKRDGGDCELVSIDGNKINVKLTGACVFCKLASATLEGIQARMIEKLGEFVRVIPVPMGYKGGH
jgi:Fe-S cluster biogenesis protein NfuA